MSDMIIDHPAQGDEEARTERWIAGLVYVLFLLGPANGLTMVLGALIALLRRRNAPSWIQTHYDFQMATLIYPLMAVALIVALFISIIGIPVALLAVILFGLLFTLWVVIRAIIGLVRLVDGRPHSDPRTFFV